jgi:hypothetical protein
MSRARDNEFAFLHSNTLDVVAIFDIPGLLGLQRYQKLFNERWMEYHQWKPLGEALPGILSKTCGEVMEEHDNIFRSLEVVRIAASSRFLTGYQGVLADAMPAIIKKAFDEKYYRGVYETLSVYGSLYVYEEQKLIDKVSNETIAYTALRAMQILNEGGQGILKALMTGPWQPRVKSVLAGMLDDLFPKTAERPAGVPKSASQRQPAA